MDIRSTGIFGDSRSANGLLQGVPSELVSQRDRAGAFWHFIKDEEIDSFTVTNITSGTAAILAASINGAMRLTATTQNQGLGSVQVAASSAGAFLTPAAARTTPGFTDQPREIFFEVGVTLSDVDNFDWFIGLGEVDTTFMSNAGALLANGGDNHVGFHHVLADAGVPAYSYCGVAVANVARTAFTAGSEASATVSDATYTQLGLKIIGTSTVEFWVDGVIRHRQTIANALAEPLTPTFCLIADGDAETMDVDYLLVAQTR